MLSVLASGVYFVTIPDLLLDWDPIQFALGLERFDMSMHSPHPPGYLGHMAIAWVFHAFGLSSARAVQLASVCGAAGAVASLWLLGRMLYGERVASLAALLFASNPLVWHQAVSGETYPLEAAINSLIVMLALQVRQSRISVAIAAFGLGLAGLVRQNITLFLTPLVAWKICAPCKNVCEVAIRSGIAIISCLAGIVVWAVPLAFFAGGPERLAEAFATQFFRLFGAAYSPLMGAPASMALRNLDGLWRFLAGALGPAGLSAILLAPIACRAQRPDKDRLTLYLAWLAPPLVWFVTMFVFKPGHVLALVPAFCLIEAAVVCSAVQSKAIRMLLVVALVFSQMALFVSPPLIWSQHISTSSLPAISYTQAKAKGLIENVRKVGSPEDSIIVTTWGGLDFRVAMYHLPEYRVIWLMDKDSTGAKRPGVQVCYAQAHKATCDSGSLWGKWDLPESATITVGNDSRLLIWTGERASVAVQMLKRVASENSLSLRELQAGPYGNLYVIELPEGPFRFSVGPYIFER